MISSLHRLQPGGRLVLISQESLSPNKLLWHSKLINIQKELATLRFSAGISGKAYYKHGTTIDTRITVFDKQQSSEPKFFPEIYPTLELESLLELIEAKVPPRIKTKAIVNQPSQG